MKIIKLLTFFQNTIKVNITNLKYIFIIITLILSFNTSGQINPQIDYPIQYWNLNTGSKIAYYYFKGKEPRKPYPIIYLHGGPGAYISDEIISAISKFSDYGYDVYLYDQIGCGKSIRLNDIKEYTVKRHLLDLEEIANNIGAEKVIFIGHSWGASLAPLYLAKHPEKVLKIIFTGPGGIIPKKININIPAPDSLKLSSNKYIDRINCLNETGMIFFNNTWSKALSGKKTLSDTQFDSLFEKRFFCDSSIFKNADHGSEVGSYCNVRTSIFIRRGKNIRRLLKQINVPVLILLGENDNLPWACVDDYLKVFKNTKLDIIRNSGHNVFTYQPSVSIDLTIKFLNDNN